MRAFEASSGSGRGSNKRTVSPARAADSAIPDPMNPAPATPSLSKVGTLVVIVLSSY